MKKLFPDYSKLFKSWELTSGMSAITDSTLGLTNWGHLAPIHSPLDGLHYVAGQNRNFLGAAAGLSAFSDALLSVKQSLPQI